MYSPETDNNFFISPKEASNQSHYLESLHYLIVALFVKGRIIQTNNSFCKHRGRMLPRPNLRVFLRKCRKWHLFGDFCAEQLTGVRGHPCKLVPCESASWCVIRLWTQKFPTTKVDAYRTEFIQSLELCTFLNETHLGMPWLVRPPKATKCADLNLRWSMLSNLSARMVYSP